MAIPIITGFDIANSIPADVKELVADSTARLAIAYPLKGLIAHQEDTDQRFLYIGTPPSNTSGDWVLKPTWLVGAIVPTTEGVDGDMWFDNATNYLYEKVTGTWTLRTDLTGSQFFSGAAAPTTEGVNGDMYFRHNGDVYQKAAGSWGSPLFNNNGTDGADGDLYATTSATSMDIDAAPATQAPTVDSGLSYTTGQTVIVASRADPLTDFFTATVTAYSATTLSLGSISYNGTGAHTDWDINLQGAVGAQGTYGKPGVADKTYTGAVSFIFDEAEITSVQGDGAWTVNTPYIAYILKDDRSNINAPAPIAGDQTGNIVTWDGTVWYNVGRVRGVDGDNGFVGWSPVLGAVTRVQGAVTDIVLQLNSWKGGTGGVPAALTALVGYYVSGSGFVSSISLATNIKGDKGDAGNTPILDVMSLNPATKNMNRGNSKATNPPISYNINFQRFTSSVAVSHTWERSNPYVATGWEQIYIKARVGFWGPKVGGINSPGAVILHLEASLGGAFTGAQTSPYGRITLETIRIPLMNGTAAIGEIRCAYAIPAPGTWFWRVQATSTSSNYYSQNQNIIYEVFHMNNNNEPAV
jgi:hypothetical protein